jgi:hypothetical protein
LHYTAISGNAAAAEILLKFGVKVCFGRWHLILFRSILQIALVGQGFYLVQQFTCSVHWAANNGHTEVLRLLLKYGAKKDLKTNSGKLPIDLAKTEKERNLLSGKLCQTNKCFPATNIELYDWLHQHELDSCCKAFGDEEVTLEVLLTISDDELKAMGLKLGVRKKILQVISSSSPKETTKELQFITDVEIGDSIGGGAFGSVFKGTLSMEFITFRHLGRNHCEFFRRHFLQTFRSLLSKN